MLANVKELLSKVSGWNTELTIQVFYTFTAFLVFFLLRILVRRIIERNITDPRARYHWYKGTGTVLFWLALLIIARIWFSAFQSILTFLGILSAGVAIALREPVASFAGWIFLIWRRPFEAGDRIQIGEFSGDVIDLRVFQFSLAETGNWVGADQHTGRIIHVPNLRVFSDPVINYTRGYGQYIFDEFSTMITFESNWERASFLLQEIGEKHSHTPDPRRYSASMQRFLLLEEKLKSEVFVRIADSGVELTLRYLVPPRERRKLSDAISRAVLEAFMKEPHIDFAYPTTRFYTIGEESGNMKGKEKND